MKTTTQLLVGGIVITLSLQPAAATAGADWGMTHLVGLHAVSQAPGPQPGYPPSGYPPRTTSLPPSGAPAGGYPGAGTPAVATNPSYPGNGYGAAAPQRPASYANPNGASRADCDRLLVTARQALASGDVRRSKALVGQAEGMRVQYGVFDDSPAKVAAAIDKFEQVNAERSRGGATETVRRRWAECLMEQSEALIKWNMLDDAERLATDARQIGVRYNAFESTPDKLLDRIADARRLEAGGARPNDNPQIPQVGAATTTFRDNNVQQTGAIERLPAVNPGVVPAANPAVAGPPATPAISPEKQQAMRYTQMAGEAFGAGDLVRAEELARQAQSMNVPWGPTEFHPAMILHDVEKAKAAMAASQQRNPYAQPQAEPAMRREPGGYPPAYAQEPPRGPAPVGPAPGPTGPAPGQVQPAEFRPQPGAPEYAQQPGPYTDEAMRLFRAGEMAAESGDFDKAMQYYRQAYNLRDGIDAALRQRIEDRLKFVPSMQNQVRRTSAQGAPEQLPMGAGEDLLAKQIQTEVLRAQYDARKLLETEPKKALTVLQEAKAKVEASALDAPAKAQLLRRLEMTTSEVEKTLAVNRPRIELEERNKATKESINRDRAYKLEVQEKLAQLVEQYNKLMDEERFREAEVVARQAQKLAPEEPAVQSMMVQVRFIRNYTRQKQIEDAKQQGFAVALESVDESAVGADDREPFKFGDAKRWEDITKMRRGADKIGRRQKSEKELEIAAKLKTPVSLRFANKPLAEVIEYLGTLAQVNIHLDPRGLNEEGVLSNTPVSIDLSQPVMLKSALGIILEPLNLSYVIKNEVLTITSEQLRDGEVYVETYSVADLVIPIPNFVPSGRLGLAAAYQDALGGMGANPRGVGAHSPVAVLASKDGGSQNAVLPPDMMAQFQGGGSTGPGYGPSPNQPTGAGPGGLGGGVQADFDSLIELITSTISPQSWDEVGGRGSIQPFDTNLSLVISQTQQVHEQIADLLDQLRRLQDLQVTIEVRFITLNDNFFERIGIDFDFDIDDDQDNPFQVFGKVINQNVASDAAGNRDFSDRDHGPTFTGGLSGPTGAGAPQFSSDLDIPFRQGSFPLAVPQFGGFAPGAGATMGFAILSDIEAFFFIEASQGDRRSNVLQAPKVTLFNGQVAFVADTAQSPFVISVIPVVGDFAAAFQPVIVVLNEGTFLSVQAVVSSDRRFVRLTLVPFFSQIGDVDEFTFTGETTTRTSSGSSSGGAGGDSEDQTTETTRSGTTVQLPTFAFVTVTTTVSVPDGGTVLLGGIKRLSEGRNEFGVPILNKLPYVNRLFRNVGIGRETQSLMMMVTPRIIIQEEEEALLGVTQ